MISGSTTKKTPKMSFEEWWMAASKMFPNPPTLSMALYNYDKDPLKTAVLIQEILKNFRHKPLIIMSTHVLAKLYCEHELYEQAIAAIEELEHSVQIDAYADTDTPAIPGAINFMKARALEGNKDLPKAAQYYKKAAENYRSANTTDMVQKCLLHAGTLENGLGKYQAAKESFDTILRLGTESQKDYDLLASTMLQRADIAIIDGETAFASKLIADVAEFSSKIRQDLKDKSNELKSKVNS